MFVIKWQNSPSKVVLRIKKASISGFVLPQRPVRRNADLACWQHFRATTDLLQQMHSYCTCDNHMAQYSEQPVKVFEKKHHRAQMKNKFKIVNTP